MTAFSLSTACFRSVTATAPSCSSVLPYINWCALNIIA